MQYEVRNGQAQFKLVIGLPIQFEITGGQIYDSTAMIPRKSNSKVGNDDMDWNLYRNRHLVENTFARLKHY